MDKNITTGSNSSQAGPRPDYRNMDNIPVNVAQKYRTHMTNLMQEAIKNIEKKAQ